MGPEEGHENDQRDAHLPYDERLRELGMLRYKIRLGDRYLGKIRLWGHLIAVFHHIKGD